MKEAILLIIAGVLAVIYNIMVLGVYSLHKNVEFKNICLFFIILNMIKDTIIFSMVLSNIF